MLDLSKYSRFSARILMISCFFFAALASAQTTEVSTRLSTENPRLNDRFLIRISEPHWAIFSEINIEALIRVSDHIAVGPTFGYMAGNDSIHKAGNAYDYYAFEDRNYRLQYGVKGSYHFNHVNESGAYISAFARKADTRVEREVDSDFTGLIGSRNGSSQFTEYIYGATAGYQWQIKRMRVHVGGGYQLYDSPETITVNYSDGSIARLIDKGNDGTLVIDGGIGLTF